MLGIAKALEVVEEIRTRSLAPGLADDLSSPLLGEIVGLAGSSTVAPSARSGT